MSDNIQAIKDVFLTPWNESRRATLKALPPARIPYLIAFTPRSGSSYLCDVLRQAKLFGRPDELLSVDFLPRLRERLAPAESPDEYVDLVLRATRSHNGVAGLKASWFQFDDFCRAMHDPGVFEKFRIIHLTRRDMVAQAVSLDRATATGVFHTNITHDQAALSALQQLTYDHERIAQWFRHISVQECGWRNYFAEKGIVPLTITYEEIYENVGSVAQRIAGYLGRPRAAHGVKPDSVFTKLAQRQSVEWGCRFRLEQDERLRNRLPEEPESGDDGDRLI